MNSGGFHLPSFVGITAPRNCALIDLGYGKVDKAPCVPKFK